MEERNRTVSCGNVESNHLRGEHPNAIRISSDTSGKDPSPAEFTKTYVTLFAMQGTAEYLVNDKRKQLDQGALLFIPPNSKVQRTRADAVILAIHLDTHVMRVAYDRISKEPWLVYPFDQKPRNEEPFFLQLRVKARSPYFSEIPDMIDQHVNKQPDKAFYCALAEAIIKAQNAYISSSSKLNFKRNSTRLEIFQRLNTAREFIEDNVHQNIHLDELSRVSCLSKYHLVRTFKMLYGKTPHQFHLDLRLRQIHKLIHSDVKISSLNSLALDFGFSDYSVFYKHYKKNYKVKPSFSYC